MCRSTSPSRRRVWLAVRVRVRVRVRGGRHTKSQHIAGAAALALPELDATTVWLDMPADECAAYRTALLGARSDCGRALRAGTTVWRASMLLHKVTDVLSQGSCKLDALVSDLLALRAVEPHMHVVVFTQSRQAHTRVSERVRGSVGCVVYELTGETVRARCPGQQQRDR
jgi:hypothetical protein